VLLYCGSERGLQILGASHVEQLSFDT
jgi:hypothetical protein